jgi:hypothetical protein
VPVWAEKSGIAKAMPQIRRIVERYGTPYDFSIVH